MNLIVAVDRNWAIGKGGDQLIYIPADLKRFKELTMGHPVSLGRKTLATFPGGRPLKNRRNIIMSRRDDYTVEGAEVAHSVSELLSMLGDDDAVVIGGESIYRLLLPYCSSAIITKFDSTFESDAFIPNLDSSPEWKLKSVSETFYAEDTDSLPGMAYTFCEYIRI